MVTGWQIALQAGDASPGSGAAAGVHHAEGGRPALGSRTLALPQLVRSRCHCPPARTTRGLTGYGSSLAGVPDRPVTVTAYTRTQSRRHCTPPELEPPGPPLARVRRRRRSATHGYHGASVASIASFAICRVWWSIARQITAHRPFGSGNSQQLQQRRRRSARAPRPHHCPRSLAIPATGHRFPTSPQTLSTPSPTCRRVPV